MVANVCPFCFVPALMLKLFITVTITDSTERNIK